MKKLIYFLSASAICLWLVVGLSSCNKDFKNALAAKFFKQVATYAKDHCPNTTQYVNPLTGEITLTFECGNLWPTESIKGICAGSQLCIDVSQGKIYGNLDCVSPITIPDLSKIMRKPAPQ